MIVSEYLRMNVIEYLRMNVSEYLRMNVSRGLSCPPSRPAMAVFRAPRRASSCITPTVTSGMEELTRAWLHNTITQMDAVVKINIAFIAVRFYKYVAF